LRCADRRPVPEIELPEIELPEIELPEIELPEIELPADRRPGPRHIGSFGPAPPPVRRAARRRARGPRRVSKGHVSDKQYNSISYRIKLSYINA
jgi:hypothetical protein